MIEKTILVVSLQFRPAHVSHLVASYKQYEELGYYPLLWVHPDFIPFLPSDIRYILRPNKDEIRQVQFAIFWFPSLKNILAILRLRYVFGAKILYVYHEPWEKYSIYRKSGNTHKWIARFYLKNLIGHIFLLMSDAVLLPSKKAVSLYCHSWSRCVNCRYHYFRLLYDDEDDIANIKRIYFSYIGTVSPDHAFAEYVDFIYQVYKNGELCELKFLIATKYVIEESDKIRELMASGRLVVIAGHPMTNDEINTYYKQSLCVWNAYNRTTQSGVLAKAFMFGTPAIICYNNVSEFVMNYKNVIAIQNNTDYNEILTALNTIIAEFSTYSINARQSFDAFFFYRTSNNVMIDIIKSLNL